MLKALLLLVCSLYLAGCANIVANRMMAPSNTITFEGTGNWIGHQRVCDSLAQCADIQLINPDELNATSLVVSIKTNNQNTLWQYLLPQTQVENPPLDQQLIVIFAGYGQPSEMLAVHQHWLSSATGAQVLVVPGANYSSPFQFGLNYVQPLIAEIKRRNPKHTHIIGFSMGAIAAEAISQGIDDVSLYLVAPMSNFEQATMAVWNQHFSNAFYAPLVSEATLNEAIEIVFNESGVNNHDLDIRSRLLDSDTPTHIYISKKDSIAPAEHWQSIEAKSKRIVTFESLSHTNMVALRSQALMQRFVSDLLRREVKAQEHEILGKFCQSNQTECIAQAED